MSTNLYDKLIIDGNNFLFRAFYVKRPDHYVNNINVTPIHQFLDMLKKVVSRFNPNEVILTWDRKLDPSKRNFRKEIVAYKEQRVSNSETDRLFSMIEHIQKFIDALGIKTIYPSTTEADDVIRYLSLDNTKQTLIVTGDRDLLQLVSDTVHVYLPNKNIVVDPNNFEEITSVKTANEFILLKSIMGDVSDNIPGLEKFGPVRAKNLVNKMMKNDSFDFDNSGLTEEQISVVKRNLTVMDLSYIHEIAPDEYISYKEQDEKSDACFSGETLRGLFREYEFHGFLSQVGIWNNLFNTNHDCSDLLSGIVM